MKSREKRIRCLIGQRTGDVGQCRNGRLFSTGGAVGRREVRRQIQVDRIDISLGGRDLLVV